MRELGIPTVEEYFRMYCLNMGIPPIDNWNFYMAFSFFRVAAILQGVYKRSLTGKPWPGSHGGSEERGWVRMVYSSIYFPIIMKVRVCRASCGSSHLGSGGSRSESSRASSSISGKQQEALS